MLAEGSEPTRTRAARGAAWLMSGAALSQTLSLFIFFVTARLISIESFGLIAISIATVEFLKRTLVEPFATALLSETDARQADFDNCFIMIAATSLAGALCVAGVAPLAASMMDEPRLTPVMQLLAFLLFIAGLSRTHEVWLVRNMQLRSLAIRSVVATTGGGSIGIAMALHGFGIWALVGQQLAAGLTSLGLLWVATDWRPKCTINTAAMTRNVRQAQHVLATNLLSFPVGEADIYFVMAYLGAGAAGVYNAAKRIAFAANMVLAKSVNTVALGTLANIPDPQRRKWVFLEAVQVVSLVTTPLFVGLALLSHELVAIVLGNRWADVAPPLAILAVGGLTHSMNQLNGAGLMVAGRASIRTWLTGSSAAATLLVVPLATAYGAAGVAGAVALIATANYLAATVLCTRTTNLPLGDYFSAIRPALLGALAMFAVSLAMPLSLNDYPPLVRLAIGSTILGTSYLVAIMAADFSGFRKLLSAAIATVRTA